MSEYKTGDEIKTFEDFFKEAEFVAENLKDNPWCTVYKLDEQAKQCRELLQNMQSKHSSLLLRHNKSQEALRGLVGEKDRIARDMDFANEGNFDEIEWRFDEAIEALNNK